METQILSEMRARELNTVLQVAKEGRLKFQPAHHNVEVRGNLMLVDPVNGTPFVFEAPVTVHSFPSKPGSGTDHLRQRTAAALFFEQLAAAA